MLGPTSGKEDLETLDRIKITNYEYLRRPDIKSRVEKKVIAQQVEKIYPPAVSRMANAIPNVYSYATELSYDEASQRLTLTLSKPHGLKVGDHVDLLTDQGSLTRIPVIAAPSKQTFSVVCHYQPQTVFVYGKWVDDFRTVDYNAISMLNVSATQELHRRLMASEQALAALQKDNQALRDRVAMMESRDLNQQARFDALEKLVRESQFGATQASLRKSAP